MSDYASLQRLALSDQGQDEAVTVNQRALIGTPPQQLLLRVIINDSRQNPCSLCIGQYDSS